MSLITAATLFVALAAQSGSVSVVDAEGSPLQDAILVQFSVDAPVTTEPREHQMAQVSRQFSPQLLVITSGDTVTFPNNDSVRHHVYSFSSPRVFEFELYSSGESPSLDFPEQGIVVVGCNIHDQMQGHIVIGADSHTRSDTDGQLAIPDTYSDNGEWYIWHPWMLDAGQQPQPFSITSEQLQLNINPPPDSSQSDLESRFQRRTLRGGH